MKFTKINIDTYEGWIPNKADLVIAEKDNIEETALTLLGFDEIGEFDEDFNNPIYGFLYW